MSTCDCARTRSNFLFIIWFRVLKKVHEKSKDRSRFESEHLECGSVNLGSWLSPPVTCWLNPIRFTQTASRQHFQNGCDRLLKGQQLARACFQLPRRCEGMATFPLVEAGCHNSSTHVFHYDGNLASKWVASLWLSNWPAQSKPTNKQIIIIKKRSCDSGFLVECWSDEKCRVRKWRPRWRARPRHLRPSQGNWLQLSYFDLNWCKTDLVASWWGLHYLFVWWLFPSNPSIWLIYQVVATASWSAHSRHHLRQTYLQVCFHILGSIFILERVYTSAGYFWVVCAELEPLHPGEGNISKMGRKPKKKWKRPTFIVDNCTAGLMGP